MKEKDNNVDNLVDQAVELYEKTGQIPVFKTIEEYANMIKERFVVPQNMTAKILKDYLLDEELQKEAVNKLVDRTPHFLELSEEERIQEITAVLTLETVAYYLNDTGQIRPGSNMYENGFDENGNVILDVFYINDTETQEEILRLQNKKRKNNIINFYKEKRKREKKK